LGAGLKGKLELGRAFPSRTLASGIRPPTPIPAQRGASPSSPGVCSGVLNQCSLFWRPQPVHWPPPSRGAFRPDAESAVAALRGSSS
jgi:hypothetical protein